MSPYQSSRLSFGLDGLSNPGFLVDPGFSLIFEGFWLSTGFPQLGLTDFGEGVY